MPGWLWIVLLLLPFFALPIIGLLDPVIQFVASKVVYARHKPADVRRPQHLTAVTPPVDRYGDHHQAERAKYRDVIRAHGGICMERDCIMPSRRIDIGGYWELGHDHQRGGATDYLGPVHRECNQAEALRRGVTWPGAPTLAELLLQAKQSGDNGNDVSGIAAGYVAPVRIDEYDPWAAPPKSRPVDDTPF